MVLFHIITKKKSVEINQSSVNESINQLIHQPFISQPHHYRSLIHSPNSANGRMNFLGGSVRPGTNGFRDEHKHLDRIYEKANMF